MRQFDILPSAEKFRYSCPLLTKLMHMTKGRNLNLKFRHQRTSQSVHMYYGRDLHKGQRRLVFRFSVTYVKNEAKVANDYR